MLASCDRATRTPQSIETWTLTTVLFWCRVGIGIGGWPLVRGKFSGAFKDSPGLDLGGPGPCRHCRHMPHPLVPSLGQSSGDGPPLEVELLQFPGSPVLELT